ncbi:small fragment nuclease isoform X1 [Stigmatopora argus]
MASTYTHGARSGTAQRDDVGSPSHEFTTCEMGQRDRSGLTQAVRRSKVTLEQAENEFLSFVRQHTPPGQCPLAGNSVHADKRFLDKYMPQFMNHLHYRIIDVSTVKEICRRWFPVEYELVPHKKAMHRALEDIRESINELKYYRANIFKANCDVQNGSIGTTTRNKQ